MTPDYVARSQAPAEAARRWTWGERIGRCACLLFSLRCRAYIYCSMTGANVCVCERLALNREPAISKRKSNAVTTAFSRFDDPKKINMLVYNTFDAVF